MKLDDKERRSRLGLRTGLALALGALALAGCGGGSGSSMTASAAGSESSASGSGGAEGAAFDLSAEARSCLKEKGVEVPEFKGGTGGPPSGGDGEPPAGGGNRQGPPEGGEPPAGAEGAPGGFGGEGSEEQKKAFEECGVEVPEFKGAPGGRPNVDSAAFKKRVREYAACVRENGYEIAEPNFSGEGPIFARAESESAAFKKASAKCESFLKGGSGESGSGGSGSGESGSGRAGSDGSGSGGSGSR